MAALDIQGIQQRIPHRYPFLLIDRVLEVEDGKRIVAIKNVTADEPFFQGHYPGRPVMPGVMIVESVAQAAAVVLAPLFEGLDAVPLLAGIDEARFRRVVTPGDQLRIEVEVTKMRSRIGRVSGKVTVDGQVAAEVVLLFAAGV